MGPERIELSTKERERLKVLHEVEQGHLKQVEAAPFYNAFLGTRKVVGHVFADEPRNCPRQARGHQALHEVREGSGVGMRRNSCIVVLLSKAKLIQGKHGGETSNGAIR